MSDSETLVQAKRLTKRFGERGAFGNTRDKGLLAIDGVDLEIRRGETLALVGESGCGKSTTGRLLMRLLEPTAGEISFGGLDLLALDARAFRRMRTRMQLIFQDPASAFNPRMHVRDIISEPMRLSGASRQACDERVELLLPMVGLADYHADRFPHEFSGGQRQRIGIARALAVQPELIICDEPVSALDVSIQAQVINLFTDLQKKFGLTYLFISHDLRVVRHIADRVAVMYLGRIVEIGDKLSVFTNPLHPYTRALIDAVPLPRPGGRIHEAPRLAGDVPGVGNIPSGCRFHPRCPIAGTRCMTDDPMLSDGASTHRVACHFAGSTNKKEI
jgi:oligopeptide/dipeptide ABC transporter ATP-binding protein